MTKPRTKICEQCGRRFGTQNRVGPIRFCTQRCYGNWLRRARPACEICGQPVKLRRNRFCSHTCATAYHRRRIQRLCETCGVSFEIKASVLRSHPGGARFCSTCYPHRPPVRVELSCQRCGHLFKVKPSEAKRGRRYCTKACSFGHPPEQPVTTKCEVCPATFQSLPSEGQRYCSLRCANSWARGGRPRTTTERNQRILELAALGNKSKTIAGELGMNDTAVRKVLSRA